MIFLFRHNLKHMAQNIPQLINPFRREMSWLLFLKKKPTRLTLIGFVIFVGLDPNQFKKDLDTLGKLL